MFITFYCSHNVTSLKFMYKKRQPLLTASFMFPMLYIFL
nr:MAG TPA: hypothetical protein [Caudoviricetes sp.]